MGRASDTRRFAYLLEELRLSPAITHLESDLALATDSCLSRTYSSPSCLPQATSRSDHEALLQLQHMGNKCRLYLAHMRNGLVKCILVVNHTPGSVIAGRRKTYKIFCTREVRCVMILSTAASQGLQQMLARVVSLVPQPATSSTNARCTARTRATRAMGRATGPSNLRPRLRDAIVYGTCGLVPLEPR